MATKAATKAKKPAAVKAAPAKKAAVKKTVRAKAKPAAVKAANKKGTKLTCGICGLVVTVDTVCNCVEVCDLVCCEMPMKVVGK